jgi:hypothetical protein
MMWLVTRPVVWPVKAAFGTGRMFGYRRLTVFVTGVVVGLLLAPVTGTELRRIVRQRVETQLGVEPAVDLTGI